jgi:putative SOS response-associated peptidase YedK
MPTGFPPGPHDWTFGLSQLRKIKQDVLGHYTELHRRYGDVVYLRFGPYPTYVFFHPDAIREVLVAKAKQFRRFRRPMQVLAQWNGNSVIITEGDEWLRQRRMVQPAFHPRRFECYADCMVARTRSRLDRWMKAIETAGGIDTEIGKEMTDLTLEIIAKTMFDAEISAETSDLARAVAILSEIWRLSSENQGECIMCGRFARIMSYGKLKEKYRLKEGTLLKDSYNISPTQSVAAVRATDEHRELVLLRWGLIPSWSKDVKIGYKLINARSETVAEKPSFRSAFKHRRCLIPASAFYEWQKQGSSRKQPFVISMRDGEPFSFAGLWESWTDPQGEVIETCTILTTTANEVMQPIHERMPVIFSPSSEEQWLDPRASGDALRSLLVPYSSEGMEARPVGLWVNNPKNDGPKCLEPASA